MRSLTPDRVARALSARLLDARASVLLNPVAAGARMHSRGHATGNHETHLHAALAWLKRAQDATPDDGFSRSFSLTWSPYFRSQGWQPSYPETTGYIIPTFYAAARWLGEVDYAVRATRAARWEIDVQLPNGAVQAGVIGQPQTPAIFNTGMVMLGWLAALEETADLVFEDALRRAGRFLVEAERSGGWTKGGSAMARKDSSAYNARAAWALAETGRKLREPSFEDAAARILRATADQQHATGWFPDCCLNDPQRPLLHTIAYTIRGLLEGGRVLEDSRLIASAARAAAPLVACVRDDGWMSGRFYPDWQDAAEWSCLTGEAQMANNWIRLYEITGSEKWLEAVPRVLSFLEDRQNCTTRVEGLRGGIAGSYPLNGEYGRYEILNWATKYFADALMRFQRGDSIVGKPAVSHLA